MLTSYEVNGHIESTYSLKTGKWTEPEFVEDPYLRIHGMVRKIKAHRHRILTNLSDRHQV